MFFQEHNIVAVLDASHPYAVEVSRCAIAACTQFNIPYLRYERPCLKQGSGWADEQVNSNCSITNYQLPITIQLDSCETLVTGNYLANQRVLLTVGYKY
jgi:precorrin-6A/cobalt-precorrin-6A reductase